MSFKPYKSIRLNDTIELIDVNISSTITIAGSSVGGFQVGAIPFGDAAGNLADDNNNFLNWNEASQLLGVGTNTQDVRVVISDAGSSDVGLRIENTSNADTAAHARSHLRVGGASGGDPFVLLDINGVANGQWYVGLDNSVSDAFCIGLGTTPSASTSAIRINTNGEVTVNEAAASSTAAFVVKNLSDNNFFIVDSTNSRVGIGGTPSTKLHLQQNDDSTANTIRVENLSDVGAADAVLNLRLVVDATNADAFVWFDDSVSDFSWVVGVDGTDDSFKICVATDRPSNATGILQIATDQTVVWNEAGNSVDFRIESNTDANMFFVDGSADFIGVGTNAPAENLHISRSINSDVTTFIENTLNSSAADARCRIKVNNTNSGDPYVLFEIGTTTYWSLGSDNSDSDTFKLVAGATLAAATALVGVTTGGTVSISGGVTQLTNGTSNRIEYGTNGVAAPGASSAGLKIKLYGANGAMATTDYAIGIESQTMWFNTDLSYKWYQDSTTLALYYQGSATANLQAWGFNNASPIARVDTVGAAGTANTAGQSPLIATGGAGGTSSNASNGGTGGYIYMVAGAGGAGSSTGAGGSGGYYLMAGGAGGANSSTGNGGAGGQFSFTGGAGGAKNSGASGNAGAGGAIYNYGGNGGDTFTTASGTAGVGGSCYLYAGSGGGMYGRAGTAAQGGHVILAAGTGGTAVASSSTAGAGGHVYISGGVGGDVDGGTTYGAAGNVYIDGGVISGGTGYGHVYIGTQNPSGLLMIGNGGTPDVTCVVSDSDTTSVGLRVENLQSNASSIARIHIRSAGASGGDPFTLYEVNAVTSYSIGIDNSDSDKLKFVVGSTPSAATGFLEVDTNGTCVFNENSTSTQDFRIETDGNANGFFLDASANAIGFNVAAPETIIHLDGSVTWAEQAGTPSNPTSGVAMRVYMKADKFIIQFNDAGTVRYKYLDLTGTGVTWVATTSAP